MSRARLDRLKALRGPGESYGDVRHTARYTAQSPATINQAVRITIKARRLSTPGRDLTSR
jgi:hypothetical protein